MKENYVSVVFVIDESSSMDVARNKVISGFNEFLADQRNEKKGDVDISLYKFSTYGTNNSVYSMVNIDNIKNLTNDDYNPKGLTALNDALCNAIDEVGYKLSQKDEKDRPSQVIFVVMTDGYENSSLKFTYEDVRERIKHQESKYSWKFVYMGCNLDDAGEAKKMGFSNIGFSSYNDTETSYKLMSNAVKNYRCVNVMDACAVAQCDSFIDDQLLAMNTKYEHDNNTKIKNI